MARWLHWSWQVRPRVRALPALALAIAFAGLGASGCASTPPEGGGEPGAVTAGDDIYGGVPGDLTIDLTVLAGRQALGSPSVGTAGVGRLSRSQQSVRYILYPDGSLHFGRASDRGTGWVPPFVRRLDRRQQAEVWALLRQTGLADPETGWPATNLAGFEAEPDERIYALALQADDRWWTITREVSGGDPDPPAMEQLIDQLSRLAWVEGPGPQRRVIVPRRYHFGPDPYARYREASR